MGLKFNPLLLSGFDSSPDTSASGGMIGGGVSGGTPNSTLYIDASSNLAQRVIVASRILISDANGIPVESTVSSNQFTVSANNPTTTSTSADPGALLLRTNGQVYSKKDSGSTTNWTIYPFSPTFANDLFTGSEPSATYTGNSNTVYGKSSGTAITTGIRNVIIGTSAGSSLTTSSDNTFVGRAAGNLTSTGGGGNTFIGRSAGQLNTTGASNTFVGINAGVNNTTASSNTFVGTSAGSINTTGTNNTFVGTSAGAANSTASSNTFVGTSAGAANTTGIEGTFIGISAGASNTTAAGNTFVGRAAGFSNTTGASNTFIGRNAGQFNTTASSNTFVGFGCGIVNTASFNVFVGTSSAQFNTSGTNNTFVGYQSGRANTTASSNTFVGLNAGLVNTTGDLNTFIGMSAGAANITGTNNVYLGKDAGLSATGSSNILIGFNAAPSSAGASNELVIGGFLTGNATNVSIVGTRSLLWASDAVADIGATGANRPRDYFGSGNGTFGGTLQSTTLTANNALASDGSKNIISSTTSATELGYVSGVTSSIQTQLNGKTTASVGDINETSFTAADNQTVAADVTVLAFANATVRSFIALVSIVRDVTYATYTLNGIQKSASWEMSQSSTGDVTGLVFSITTAGQVQYTSTSTGFTALVKFRAQTTTV